VSAPRRGPDDVAELTAAETEQPPQPALLVEALEAEQRTGQQAVVDADLLRQLKILREETRRGSESDLHRSC
jgi:hypothetical protein